MDQCARCGHGLGVGRFCTNCGHGVDRPVPIGDEWRSGTAERPALTAATAAQHDPPAAPPPAFELPAAARFPLFADEVHAADATPATYADQAPVWTPTNPTNPTAPGTRHREARGALPWIAVAAALAVIAGLGTFLLLDSSADNGPGSATASDTPRPGDVTSDEPSNAGSSDAGSSDAPAPPSETSISPSEPRDVARLATAVPPATATPSRDVTGNSVRYDASYMLDGQPDTAWRMPGEASGSEVLLTLDGPTEINEVGLINGYAKTAPGYDGYTANRRILAVEWVFADGTVVPQSLVDGDRGVQTVPIDEGNVTDTITLRITAVSRPAKGAAGRDYTAISDVALVGKPV